ncbi:hypothetical protein [Xanthobacter flavus]|uniref:hypothetical protein n=1 Tax=Xanthobacter flavus TaxID=281 RepID=UPI001AE2A324|nr:hypothetical protein [Xanthobacter flavus]MBP2147919.1 hypothetical protein [Xanthobacter flavus]
MAPRLGSVRDSFALASAASRLKASLDPVVPPAPGLPGFRRLTLWRGSPLQVMFRLRTSDGALFDLAGSEMVYSFAWDGGELSLSSAADEVDVDEAGGLVTLVLSPEQTAPFPPGGSAVQYQLTRVIAATPYPIVHGPVDVYQWMP